MSRHMTLTVEPPLGCTIETASTEAIRVANLLQVHVRFFFNGIRCLAYVGGDPMELVAQYGHAVEHKLTMAFSSAPRLRG